MSEKRIALVTGANKGIGFAIADQLAQRGMTVLVGARDRERREKAVADLTGDVHGIELDVTDPATARRAVTEAVLSLLRPGARIVNVSSSVGSLADMTAPDGGHLAEMPAMLGYPVSRTALNAPTAQYAKYLRDKDILVNAVCPGYTATDLNGHDGERTPDQGAAIAVRMATLGPDGPTAGFFDDGGRIAW